MGQTDVFDLPWPELGDLADGPDGYEDLARAVEAALLAQQATADDKPYTLSWTSTGTVQPSAGVWVSRYSVRAGRCFVSIEGNFNSTTRGGNGDLHITLPVRARNGIANQSLWCRYYSSWHFTGFVNVVANSQSGSVYLPISGDDNRLIRWRNAASGTNTPGTGVPTIPGAFTVQAGSNLVIAGSYLV